MAPVCKVAARRFRSMLHTCFRAQLSAKIRRRKGIFASIIYVKNMQHLRSDTWALVQFEQPHQLVEAGKLYNSPHGPLGEQASLSSSSTSLVYAIPRSIRIAAKYEVEVLRFTQASRLALHVKEKELAASCLTSGTQARESPRPVSTRISLGSRTQQ